MESSKQGSSAVFEVYLRLRPHSSIGAEQFIHIDEPHASSRTSITIKPPENDHRKRPVEKFCFTRVFDQQASQIDVFNETNIIPLVEGVLAPDGRTGRDGLLATLGVTGSGKSHTILGTRSQRGLTQMTLDVLFKSTKGRLALPQAVLHDIAATDVTGANLACASSFLDHTYGSVDTRAGSRAQTPMSVSSPSFRTLPYLNAPMGLYNSLSCRMPGAFPDRASVASVTRSDCDEAPSTIKPVTGFARVTASVANLRRSPRKETNTNALYTPSTPSKRHRAIPTALPQAPYLDEVLVAADTTAEYAIVVSMYEIYNDQIFDLLNDPAANNTSKTPGRELRRRPLLFKSTEYSPDRKVVAGLRKIVCGSLEEALLVLETGLAERTTAGTGSNATSSRGHGFFCVEVKKRSATGNSLWKGSTLTIVDMAGTERARTAKTAGATLAEAGKINESLMWLGQYMQFQLDKNPPQPQSTSTTSTTTDHPTSTVHMPPPPLPSSSTQANSKLQQAIRRCKLTELLFSNSSNPHSQPQKAIMIVTADPRGDYNATSQMLRYSALAREVTQPRIPSVSSIVGWNNNKEGSSTVSSRPGTSDGVASAAAAVAILQRELKIERELRLQAEIRAEEVEVEVRAECWDLFDQRLQAERNRWEDAFDDAVEAQERHVDAKVGIVSRGLAGFTIHEDACAPPKVMAGKSDVQLRVEEQVRNEELIRENKRLQEEIRTLKHRYDVSRTPSRKMKTLKPAKPWALAGEDAALDMAVGNEENVVPGGYF
ncbi:MAG: hypothetical protein M1828_000467 [Chrysothrix sp. TS-e1954]|nr:MAG: hypothetical protein M1828_000467 [Chrysothrix sp. TS-e1954]